MLDRALPGIQALQHIVVLMMENRSFDHMLGALHATRPRDRRPHRQREQSRTPPACPSPVSPLPSSRASSIPTPTITFPAVDLQIFGGVTTAQNPNRQPNMQGFVKSYFNQQQNVAHSRKIMNYFTPDKLPVLTILASEFAVFNRWFSSIPGPTLCNRAFAHYGTSFGQVSMDVFYWNKQYKSIYERLVDSREHRKTLLLRRRPAHRSKWSTCCRTSRSSSAHFRTSSTPAAASKLPQYCFIEPNYTDHDAPDGAGELLACDQHPDHDVRAGEQFIATVYNAIRKNPNLWPHTAILIVYDEHGGTFDHVLPPSCTPDGFVAQPSATQTPDPFHFDRFGVRVPAVLISPWVQKGLVIGDKDNPNASDIFEHASIPGTITEYLIGACDQRSPREKVANNFLQYLRLPSARPDSDCPTFTMD